MASVSDQKKAALSAAARTSKLKKEASEQIANTNVSDLDEEIKKHIVYMTDDMLVEDPENQKFYRQREVTALATVMKEMGFQGVILAYPHKGKYMIESGHRRRLAAKEAGIEKFPVFITEPPKTWYEQRIRLFNANLLGRKPEEFPIETATIMQGMYEAEEARVKDLKKKGADLSNEPSSLNEKVALRFQMDKSSVEKYRALLRLIPSLQKLADSGDYSWSDLSQAAPMSKESQEKLYGIIMDRTQKRGIDSINRKWLTQEIRALKIEEIDGAIEKKNTTIREETDAPIRRRNGTKTIKKTSKQLHMVLDYDAIYEKEDIPEVVKMLEDLRTSIDKKLKEFSEEKMA